MRYSFYIQILTARGSILIAMKNHVKLKVWNLAVLLLLLVGIILIVYPKWTQYVEDQRELRLLTEWDALPKENTQVPATALPIKTSHTTSTVKTKQKAPEVTIIDGLPVYGTVSIEKIDLREPMVKGATAKSLKLGSGVVVPERLPGEIGNYVLASHRSRTFGRHFNRLDELESGDEIKLETSNDTFVYKVNSKVVVKPTDLSVLDQNKNDKELTLITCEPPGKSTHRLIVKAVMEEQNK